MGGASGCHLSHHDCRLYRPQVSWMVLVGCIAGGAALCGWWLLDVLLMISMFRLLPVLSRSAAASSKATLTTPTTPTDKSVRSGTFRCFPFVRYLVVPPAERDGTRRFACQLGVGKLHC